MKRLFLFLFILVSGNLFSQIQVKLYYDSLLKICRKSEAKYVREAHIDNKKFKFIGEFADYSLDGTKILTGNYNSEGLKDGEFIFYNENGNIYCKGDFKENILFGKWFYYYPNGQIRYILEFDSTDFKVKAYLNLEGESLLPQGTGEFKFNFINIFESEINQYVKGKLLDSLKVKTWNICDNKRAITSEIYKKNEFKYARYHFNEFSREKIHMEPSYYYEYNNLIILYNKKPLNNYFFIPHRLYRMEILQFNNDVASTDYPFFNFLYSWDKIQAVGLMNDSTIFNLDSLPQYIGGMEKLKEYVAQNLRYPIAAMEKKIKGKVYMEIIIDESGTISSIQPANASNQIFVDEAVRVLSNLGKFKPGYYKGETIKTKFVFPITFNSPLF